MQCFKIMHFTASYIFIFAILNSITAVVQGNDQESCMGIKMSTNYTTTDKTHNFNVQFGVLFENDLISVLDAKGYEDGVLVTDGGGLVYEVIAICTCDNVSNITILCSTRQTSCITRHKSFLEQILLFAYFVAPGEPVDAISMTKTNASIITSTGAVMKTNSCIAVTGSSQYNVQACICCGTERFDCDFASTTYNSYSSASTAASSLTTSSTRQLTSCKFCYLLSIFLS